MTKSTFNLTTTLAVALGLSLALLTEPVSAKGPKASVNSATECALHLGEDGSGEADLVITTTLTNKSSGGTVPELRYGSQIQSTFKKQIVRGNVFFHLVADPVVLDNLPENIDPSLTVSAIFDLCSEQEDVTAARELNGTATMMYGISDGSEIDHEVENRCTDDPETEDVNEGGIKVDDATSSSIAVACGW